jgi:hypothetical protein
MEAFDEGYITSLIKEIEQTGCRCSTFFGCSIHSLCNGLRFTLFPKIELPIRNYCNLYSDCVTANNLAASVGKVADHCHDDCCEDCFGN